jgi:C-terminal processing protease CtpA/Prc
MYTYYKYDGSPPIVAVRTGSPSDRAGVKIGDLLLRIDGKSVAESDGALALARLDKKDSVRLTIRRDGREIDFVISAPR